MHDIPTLCLSYIPMIFLSYESMEGLGFVVWHAARGRGRSLPCLARQTSSRFKLQNRQIMHLNVLMLQHSFRPQNVFR
jgi:hypothetical protein